jgi:hypothetical protein
MVVLRGALAVSPPRRYYAGMEAGDKVGTKTGYEYLAPSPPLDKAVSPNITHHALKSLTEEGGSRGSSRLPATVSSGKSMQRRKLTEFAAPATTLV